MKGRKMGENIRAANLVLEQKNMSEKLFGTSSSDSTSTQKNYRRHPPQLFLRDCKLASGHPASSQISWTDEKHSLYLNYIEDAFVTSLYDEAYYTGFGKRLQAGRGEKGSVNSQNLTEEVESQEYNEPFTCPEESQSESEMREGHSKSGDNTLGRTKKRKSENGFKGALPGPQSAKHSTDHESVTSKYRGRRQITREASDPSAKILNNNRQEDQVVPSTEDPPGREDVRL